MTSPQCSSSVRQAQARTRRARAFGPAVAFVVALLSATLAPGRAFAQLAAPEGTPRDLPDTAFDLGGCARGEVGGPSWAVNLASLQLSIEATDLQLRGRGPDVRLRRAYSATQTRSGLLGSLWRFDYEARVVRMQGGALLELPGGHSVSFTGALWDAGASRWRTTDLVLTTEGTSHERLTYVATGPAFLLDEAGTRWLWRFEPAGADVFRLASIADRHNNAITFQYDGGRLSRLIDASGRVTEFGLDGAGRATSVRVPDGRTARFEYDALGRLAHSWDMRGTRTSYEYDGGDPHVVGIVTAARTRFEWASTAPKRIAAVVDPAFATTRYALDPASGVTTVTSPLGYTREVTHQGGLRTRERDGWWRDVRTEYSAGRPVRVLDGNGETRFEYGADGNLTRRIDPQGRATSYAWNVDRLLTSRTDATGATWRYDYDDDGRFNLLVVTSPLQLRTTFEYDGQGLLVSETDATQVKRRFTWDNARGTLLAISDRTGRVLSFAHDERNGRLLRARTRSGGAEVEFAWDELDRLASVAWAGASRTFAYNDCAVATVQDENRHQVAYAWDAAWRTLGVTDAAGGVLRFDRDLDGTLTAIRDPLDNVSRSFVERASSVVQITDAASLPWRMEYDGRGRLLRLTDPLGSLSAQTWNTAGELVAFRDPLNHEEGYTRDALGRVGTLVTAMGRRASFAYDADGRPSRVTHDTEVHRWTYDSAGQVLERRDGAQLVAFAHDAEGRVTSMTWGGALQSSFAYDTGGRLAAVSHAGGPTASYTYDARERVRSATVAGLESRFDYDAADRLVSIARPNGVTTSFGWDAVGRATRVTHRSTAAGTFVDLSIARDAAGNVVAVTGVEPVPRGAQLDLPVTSYNRAGQVVSRGTDQYAYSAAGDLNTVTGLAPWTADYDPQHRLVSLTRAGRVVRFAWDADGRRIAREADGGVRREFHYGPDGTLLFESENGQRTRSYVYVDGRLFAMVDGAGVRYFHFDHLGSTVAITSAGGQVIGAFGYDPAGRATAAPGSPETPFTFVGEFGAQSEGNGLYVMGPRVYDATTMRFLQRHPHGLAAGPQLYEYAGGNPTTLVAPEGLGGWLPTAGARAGGGHEAIAGVLGTLRTYEEFAPGVELANRAAAVPREGERTVGVRARWAQPFQPPTAPVHDFWSLWGVLR